MGALTAEHVAQLEKSGISEAFAEKNQVASVADGLRFQYFGSNSHLWNTRLDRPSDPKRKYLRPKDCPVCIYRPPRTDEELKKAPIAPLFFVEGEKKTLALLELGFPTIGLQGVDCWSIPKRENADPKDPRQLLDEIAQLARSHAGQKIILFDADPKPSTQKNTSRAALLFARRLEELLCTVRIGRLALSSTGEKMGVDDWLALLPPEKRSGFVWDIIESAVPPAYFTASGDRRIISVRDLVAGTPPRQPMIEGLLPEHTISIFCGPKKIGKSAAIQHMAIAIASGGTVFGRFQVAAPRPVLLIDVDQGRHNAADRWRRALPAIAPSTADLIERWHLPHFLLASQEDLGAVESWARYVRELKGCAPFISIDTFRSAIPLEISENDSAVGLLLNALRPIVDESGASIVIVHHTNAGGGFRGSTAIPAAADDIWLAKALEKPYFAIDFSDMRTGASPDPIAVSVNHEDYGVTTVDAPDREESDTKAAILRVLISEPLSCAKIGAAIGRHESTVFRVCEKLARENRAIWIKRRGFKLAEEACASLHETGGRDNGWNE